jgi:hypothetical protein
MNNTDIRSLYGLKYNPFLPDLPPEALYAILTWSLNGFFTIIVKRRKSWLNILSLMRPSLFFRPYADGRLRARALSDELAGAFVTVDTVRVKRQYRSYFDRKRCLLSRLCYRESPPPVPGSET